MSHSYTYTKNFIQSQVNILNEPYRINSRIRNILAEQDEITESELQTILNLLNNEIKECNDELFPSQINNQIASQILKLEKQKLKIVNSQLFKINSFIKPITLPDFDNLTNQDQNKKLAELREQIKELPDSKYLFVSSTDTTDIQDEYDLDDDDQGQDMENEPREEQAEDNETDKANTDIVQDDQEEVASTKQMKKEFIQEIADKVNDSNAQPDQELIEKYDKLRTDLIDISDRLQYKSGKLGYLSGLQQTLSEIVGVRSTTIDTQSNQIYDSDEEVSTPNDNETSLQPGPYSTRTNIQSEINRFRMLVEKISYKVNTKNLTSDNLREKLQEINHNPNSAI
ncbi:putative protein of unknown function, transcription is positively regulated by Tbf1p [Candida albicans P60002]|nr:putative protein of unknown function, transcription is positively regulated by Tbf1p [Candida albicans P60002]KHC63781.1 putative protein of unknown function, transcription is positively regulated by Tbf1p [Candida albicans P75010]